MPQWAVFRTLSALREHRSDDGTDGEDYSRCPREESRAEEGHAAG
jgi:hypothetical protein